MITTCLTLFHHQVYIINAVFSIKIDFDVNEFNRTKETDQETRIATLNRIEMSSLHSVKKLPKIAWLAFNRYWQILQNSSRNFSEISVFQGVKQTDF